MTLAGTPTLAFDQLGVRIRNTPPQRAPSELQEFPKNLQESFNLALKPPKLLHQSLSALFAEFNFQGHARGLENRLRIKRRTDSDSLKRLAD